MKRLTFTLMMLTLLVVSIYGQVLEQKEHAFLPAESFATYTFNYEENSWVRDTKRVVKKRVDIVVDPKKITFTHDDEIIMSFRKQITHVREDMFSMRVAHKQGDIVFNAFNEIVVFKARGRTYVRLFSDDDEDQMLQFDVIKHMELYY